MLDIPDALDLGDYGIRGELAYTDSVDKNGSDPGKFNSELFGVFGVDRSFVENFNLNVQMLYKHVFNFLETGTILDPNRRLIALQENLIANQLGLNRFGVLVRPKATYAINDQFNAVVGAEEYFGTKGSFFGRLSEVSSVFSELRLSF